MKQRNRNIAARMGHWSATHRKKAIWGWLAFVIVAFAVGNVIGTKSLKPEDTGVGESGRVDKILGDEFETPATERVMIQSTTLRARISARTAGSIGNRAGAACSCGRRSITGPWARRRWAPPQRWGRS